MKNSPDTGLISGTVDYTAAEFYQGHYQVGLTVGNGHGGSASQTFTWTVADTDRPPVLTNPGDQTSAQGDPVSLQLQASDPDNDPLTFDATGLPAGLIIDGSTGVISGTVDLNAAQQSPYSVTVTASDGTLTDSQTFDWTVTATNRMPVLANPGDQNNTGGDTVSLPITAADSDGDKLTYTATGLPTGLAIDPGSGVIAGTIDPSAASDTPYTVTVTTSDGALSDSQTFSWQVNFVGLDNPGDQSSAVGDSVALPLFGTGPDGATLTYTAQDGSLPPGLQILPGSDQITGTIDAGADTGSPYTAQVFVSDGTHTASQTFTWTVGHLSFANPGPQVSTEGMTVSLPLTAHDGDGDGITFTAQTALPPGLTLGSDGTISGSISAGAALGSPYTVQVTAADPDGNSVSQTFLWTVTPQVVVVSPGNQTSATNEMVSLQVNAHHTLGASLKFSATGLPPGLSIDTSTGLISGRVASDADTGSPYTTTVTAANLDGSFPSAQSLCEKYDFLL